MTAITPRRASAVCANPIAGPVNASDIQSAEKLEEQGMFEFALTVYRRCLEECKAKIDKGVPNNRAIDDRVTVSNKLWNLAIGFFSERNFEKALEAIELPGVALEPQPSRSRAGGRASGRRRPRVRR